MAVERPRGRKLTEFVSDHVLGDEHRDVLVSVMHAERQPHELRQDGRAARPDLDHGIGARAARPFGLLEQITVNGRAFPDRTSHVNYPFFWWRLRRTNLSPDLFERVFLPLVDLPQGVTGWRRADGRPARPPGGRWCGLLATRGPSGWP